MIEESLWSLPWAGVPQGHHHPLPPGSTRRGRLGCRRGRYSHRVLTTALLLPALAAAPQGPQHPVVPEAFDPIHLGDKEGHESDAPFFPAAVAGSYFSMSEEDILFVFVAALTADLSSDARTESTTSCTRGLASIAFLKASLGVHANPRSLRGTSSSSFV